MEYVPDGSLREYINTTRKTGKRITEENASKIIKSLMLAVEYFHNKDIIHRDIKPGRRATPFYR